MSISKSVPLDATTRSLMNWHVPASKLFYLHLISVIAAKASKLKYRIFNKLDKKLNNLKRKYGIPQLSNLNNDDIIFN